MHKRLLMLLAAASLLGGCSLPAVPKQPRRLAPGPQLSALLDCLRQNGQTLAVAAHGQASPTAPENSLAGITEALGNGALAIQLDLRQTADGEPILLLDASLDRTTTGRGAVSTKTFAETRRLALRTSRGLLLHEPPPSLDEALIHAKRKRVLVFLSASSDMVPQQVVSDIARNRMEPYTIVMVPGPNLARHYVSLAPDLAVALRITSASEMESLMAEGLSAGRLLAVLDERSATPTTMQRLRQLGVASVLDISPADPDAAVRAGASFVLTARPGEATNHLEAQGVEGGACYMEALEA